MARWFSAVFLLCNVVIVPCSCASLPVVINTWPFVESNIAAAHVVENGSSYLDAIEMGCSVAEQNTSITSVGYGGSPNEDGETTLDAMIMDGQTHDVGSVGCLKEVKNAISVARSVMEHTQETLLVGEDATRFAVSMGFKRESLTTNDSREIFSNWKAKNCQPNYWQETTVTPDPATSCGPYSPNNFGVRKSPRSDWTRPPITESNHDTIGMIVVDANGKIGCGTSTNGANHKIPGRVGDSPIIGSGCYVQAEVGGAAATGDGDIMMRFVPAHEVVLRMEMGMHPQDAVVAALKKIKGFYPSYHGAMVAVTTAGVYGAAYTGFGGFQYTVYNPELGKSTVLNSQPVN